MSRQELLCRRDWNHLQRFESLLNRHGASFSTARTTLDFGCHTGRLIAPLLHIAPQARVWGCDINPRSIAVSRKSYPQAHFILNGTFPALHCSETFDVIYSYSVFTHLSRVCHIAWLKELGARLRPGGIMLHTIHSEHAIRRMCLFSQVELPKYGLPPSAIQVGRQPWGQGYYYQSYDVTTPDFGLAVITEEYVRSEWPGHASIPVIEYAPAAIESYPEGCHDIVVMRKPIDAT